MISEYFFDDRAALLQQLQSDMQSQVDKVLAASGAASLLLSGGSTPGPVYEALGQALDDRVQVALVDDRWVDLAHAGSNEALLRRCFPNHYVLGMKTADAMPQTAVAQINERYSSLVTPFALTLLGMGPDGHTASLFPDAEGLTEALAPNAPMCAAIRAVQSDVTGPLVDRMTLTLSAILNSQRVILLITGEEKLAVYQRAKTASDIQAQPVAAVLQQAQVPVDVYWAK